MVKDIELCSSGTTSFVLRPSKNNRMISKIGPLTPYDLSLWRRSAYLTLSKALEMTRQFPWFHQNHPMHKKSKITVNRSPITEPNKPEVSRRWTNLVLDSKHYWQLAISWYVISFEGLTFHQNFYKLAQQRRISKQEGKQDSLTHFGYNLESGLDCSLVPASIAGIQLNTIRTSGLCCVQLWDNPWYYCRGDKETLKT